jgi:hypothetical protein
MLLERLLIGLGEPGIDDRPGILEGLAAIGPMAERRDLARCELQQPAEIMAGGMKLL